MTLTLPNSETEYLLSIRQDLPRLRARTAALKQAGWTLASVGVSTNTNRSTAKTWFDAADPVLVEIAKKEPALPRVPLKTSDLRTVQMPPNVPVHKHQQLKDLSAAATQVRGWTPQDSPQRQAARELDALLAYYSRRGVPGKWLANILNVTHRAVAVRLERAKETVSV